MPEPAHPAVIATDLADAARFTEPRGGTWCRLLVGRDRPSDVAGMAVPSVAVTERAMVENGAEAHALVEALGVVNPSIEVHLPWPPTPFTSQDDIDRTRAELEADTDEVLGRRGWRQDQPLADWELELLDIETYGRPPVGSFGLSRIGGWVGALVTAGQAVLWDGSRYTHAFVVIDDGWVVQAMPDGAELAPLGDYLGRDDVAFCDDPVDVAITNFAVNLRNLGASEEGARDLSRSHEWNLRRAIAAHARDLVGTPYSFADYLALATVRLGLPSWTLRRYVASSGRMICSQLVDEVYRRAGVHLFDDGRPSQDVTPGDLDAWRVTQLELRAAR